MGILSKLTVVEYGNIQEFLNFLGVEEGEDWEEVVVNIEKEYPDMVVFSDKELGSLVDMLRSNGLSEEEILKRNKAMYGGVLDFYYISEDVYILLSGVR